jgi:hypothetical protein
MGLGLIALSCVVTVPAQLPPLPPPGVVEVAPMPHVPYPPVEIGAVKGGYQVALNRRTAELLRDALEKTDEKNLAATLKKMAKERKEKDPDDQSVKTLEMVAFVVSTQLPGFKKSLNENIGPRGAVITLTGLQAPMVKFKKPRPRLEKAAEIVRGVMPLLPEEAQEVVEALRAVGRTTPLFWKVEPRE